MACFVSHSWCRKISDFSKTLIINWKGTIEKELFLITINHFIINI
ncbi:hypothetical protein MuYL_1113 [Mucilaginibacter xinganensis]|uniref:Uncharacterized protein n=1 Tax=Mucilaginibacter xinganensis TaxID=1234841 RepID=A0A223NT31_9SPHI|nr:hypothetical protein MuYL_1113 [Mucilaginibacter xinganensis]